MPAPPSSPDQVTPGPAVPGASAENARGPGLGGWAGPAGYKRLLDLAAPMLVSMGAYTFMLFCDRVFLSWRSSAEIAAVVPATAVLMTVTTLFFGTVIYSSTFVAQYFGAGHIERIGRCFWAAVCVALLGQVVVGVSAVFAKQLFGAFRHAPAIQALEVEYYVIAAAGVGAHMTSVALSAVYSGRGITRPGMWVSCVQAGLNIPLNYALIFGRWGAPELGMGGAALATVFSQWVGLFLWAGIVFRRENEEKFHIWASRGVPWPMLRRLIRFGVPNGMHFFLDASAWTAFSLLVGQLGVTALAGSNIAWQVNTLALLPIIGIGLATGILVGQFQGGQKPDHAEAAARSGLVLAMAYMSVLAALLVLVPHVFIYPFTLGDLTDMAQVEALAENLLTYVALLGFVQGVQFIYGFALKGAGDVRYIISVLAVTSSVGFVLPVWWMVQQGYSVERLWIWFVIQATFVMLLLRRRFRSGAWRSIRMIEVDPIVRKSSENQSDPSSDPRPAVAGGT